MGGERVNNSGFRGKIIIASLRLSEGSRIVPIFTFSGPLYYFTPLDLRTVLSNDISISVYSLHCYCYFFDQPKGVFS